MTHLHLTKSTETFLFCLFHLKVANKEMVMKKNPSTLVSDDLIIFSGALYTNRNVVWLRVDVNKRS